jgi:hypothetical protein
MKRWRGWGECLITIASPELREGVKGTRCVGAGIGTDDVFGGRLIAEERRRLVEKLVRRDK